MNTKEKEIKRQQLLQSIYNNKSLLMGILGELFDIIYTDPKKLKTLKERIKTKNKNLSYAIEAYELEKELAIDYQEQVANQIKEKELFDKKA